MLPPKALAGLRVLDLTTLLAAPQIAAMLGDFGADVVKIEPLGGDPLRQIGVRRGTGSPAWAWVSRNKRAITLDLDHADGRRVFQRLAAEADVLVENLTPALRERWECGYDTLSRANPRLVVVSVSCFGQTGPLAAEPGAGALAEAFAGFAHMNGEADGPPLLPSLPLGDAMTGFSGVIGGTTPGAGSKSLKMPTRFGRSRTGLSICARRFSNTSRMARREYSGSPNRNGKGPAV